MGDYKSCVACNVHSKRENYMVYFPILGQNRTLDLLSIDYYRPFQNISGSICSFKGIIFNLFNFKEVQNESLVS